MKRVAAVFLTGAALLATQPIYAQMGAPGTERPGMPAVAGPLAAKYKGDADKILQAAMTDNDGYAALAYLTTDPLYADLRLDPRFTDLARRIGLSPA